jgi:hypothetical protein
VAEARKDSVVHGVEFIKLVIPIRDGHPTNFFFYHDKIRCERTVFNLAFGLMGGTPFGF